MLASLALAASLWLASQEAGARPAVVNDDPIGNRPIFQVKDEVPVEKVADDFARDLYWIVGGHSADLYATAWAIQRCNGACGEGNPLGPTAEARIALKMAGTASTALTIWKLRRDGHGRAATVMRWASVLVNAALVVNNTRHAIRRR